MRITLILIALSLLLNACHLFVPSQAWHPSDPNKSHKKGHNHVKYKSGS